MLIYKKKNNRFMKKSAVLWGAFFGFLAVILGAFASHLLKNKLSTEALASFEIGVRYQMYHALFLLFLSFSKDLTTSKFKYIKSLVVIGVFLFSGSIYVLAFKDFFNFNPGILVFLTPLGGTCLLVAWVLLIINFLNQDKKI